MYVVLFLTHSLSVALFTLILLIFGSDITYKLSQTYNTAITSLSPSPLSSPLSPQSPQSIATSTFQQQQRAEILKKRLLVGRIVTLLIICFLCYLLRVILIVLNVYDYLYPGNHREFTEWPLGAWFFVSSVIPSVGPVSSS